MKHVWLLVLLVGCVDELPTLSGEPIDVGPDAALDAAFDAAVDAPIDAGTAEYGRRIAAVMGGLMAMKLYWQRVKAFFSRSSSPDPTDSDES